MLGLRTANDDEDEGRMNAKLRAQILNGIVLAAVLMVGFIIGHISGPPPIVQEIAGAVRYVDREVIVEREPDAKAGRIERIARPTVPADYVAIAPNAGDSTRDDFCKWYDADSIVSDSVVLGPKPYHNKPEIAPILIRSIRESSRLFPWQKASVIPVSVSGSGDLSERRYQVRQGFSLVADSDSLVVQHPRIPFKPLVGSAILIGAGALIGAAIW
jgi:hypothetical protein